MSKPDQPVRPLRRSIIESLEDRLAMSADPLGGLLGGAISHHGFVAEQTEQHAADATPAPTMGDAALGSPAVLHGAVEEPPVLALPTQASPDFWLDPIENQIDTLSDSLGDLQQTLASAHDTTGLSTARANYGFTGAGQTVAVIDSGIAYDHYALGGGFGAGYRVVGGYDFTGENDADPYDDGPSGSHGTHVAGIIGSSDATHQGVAPGADLVGLRVFDDAGAGYFSWVENALQWVYDNRAAFENPITAVNLSLGTNWNSDSIPSWANLENEFAQLEAVGIFISVSAGNSFTSYNTPGLSYPAASPYVVPVASVDDSGFLSYFSQRNDRVIAAPGRFIRSTVPDYAGNNNGVADDFANFSGTSMAAPYVAGASVLVREAMEFVGYTNITQDVIYDHLIATADSVFDSATNLSYARLNLGAAIDALIPADEFGSSVIDAHSIGTINAGPSTAAATEIGGVISTLDDSDYFTFTAGATGTVTFTATSTTHNLAAEWHGDGGQGWSSEDGLSYTIEVVAGQQYTIGLSSSDGLGYYDLAVTAEQTFQFVDWGAVTGQQTHAGVTVDGETYYRIVAGQDGYLTADLLNPAGSPTVELYDASLNLIDAGDGARVDALTTAGTEFFLRVDGLSSATDIRLTNAVGVADQTVTVDGGAGDDALAFTAGAASHVVSINGVAYNFNAATHDTFNLNGGAGDDTVYLSGTDGDEAATLRPDSVDLVGAGFAASTANAESVSVAGQGGDDRATFYDSAADDTFTVSPHSATITGPGYANSVDGFNSISAFAYGGGANDRAFLYDSVGDDVFSARPEWGFLSGDGFTNSASGFERISAYANAGGDDYAYLYDSSGDDQFTGRDTWSVLSGVGFSNSASGFDRVSAYATTGSDRAYLYDSAGSDRFVGQAETATLSGAGFSNVAKSFDQVSAYALAGGDDRAYLYDSAGDDSLTARPDWTRLQGAGFSNFVAGFNGVSAFSTAGGANDRAYLYDSAGDDVFVARPEWGLLSGAGFGFSASGFDRINAYSVNGGTNDRAYLYDSAGDDVFTSRPEWAVLVGANYSNSASGFDRVIAAASLGGNDRAFLYGAATVDTLVVGGASHALTGVGFNNSASGFAHATAYGGGGDVAVIELVGADDAFMANDNLAQVRRQGFEQFAYDFDSVTATVETEATVEINEESLSFAFEQLGPESA